jgi:hypothetical protein
MTYASTVPFPNAIDDECLKAEPQDCQQPEDTFSQTEFYVRTLHLYEILRDILSRVYRPWEDGKALDETDGRSIESTQIQTLIELDGELLSFKLGLPIALQWHVENKDTDYTEGFRRESSLLRARLVSSSVSVAFTK